MGALPRPYQRGRNMDAIDMRGSHMYDLCMPIDVEEEVISALGSPKGREILAEVFETVLERRAKVAANPLVGVREAAKMIGVKSKTEAHLAKAQSLAGYTEAQKDAIEYLEERARGGRAEKPIPAEFMR